MVPDLELIASALNVDLVLGVLVVSLSVILEGANPDVVVSVTVARGMGGLVKAQRMVDPKGKDKGLLA